MAYDTVANLEARDALSHLDDLAGEIAAHDEGIFDPGKHYIAGGLFEPVERVDGDRAVLDDNFVLARWGVGGRLDIEGCDRFGGQKCRVVGRHDALAEAARYPKSSKTGRFERRI